MPVSLIVFVLLVLGIMAAAIARVIAVRRAKARAATRDMAFGRIRGFLDVLNESFLRPGENLYAPNFEGGELSDGSEYFRISGEIEGCFDFDCMEIVSGAATRYRFLFQETGADTVFRGEARDEGPISDRLAALFGKYHRLHEEMRASFRKARDGGPSTSTIDTRKLRGEHLS